MRRLVAAALAGAAVLAAPPAPLPAADLNVAAVLMIGSRTLGDPDLKAVYGAGTVYCPALLLQPGETLFLGAAYEGGFVREGTIGLYEEATTLRVSGIEVFGGLRVRANPVVFYARAGYGPYRYRQTVESPAAGDFPVRGIRWALSLAGGLRAELGERLFLMGELKLVPLTVQPYATPVDLGGLRTLVGLGYSFSL